MSKKEKQYHFIYKTTDTRNYNFYIGMHSTDNLNDGYVGSGNRIKNIKYKHGVEIFNIDILEFFPDRESLKKREEEIVNSNLLKEDKCMNLKPGGSGGFCNDEHKQKYVMAGSIAGNLKLNELYKNPEYGKYRGEKYSRIYRELPIETKEKILKNLSFLGKTHTKETKLKLSKKRQKKLVKKTHNLGRVG